MTPLEEAALAQTFTNARHWAIMPPDGIVHIAQSLDADRSQFSWRELARMLAKCHDEDSAPDGIEEIALVDVDEHVRLWVEHIAQMATAHSHDEYSRLDEQTDGLLIPLLTAPMSQLREFTAKVAAGLQTDARVPFGIWSSYETAVARIIAVLPDGDEITLRTDLAAEIAAQAEALLDRGSLVDSIAAALKWRSPEALTKIKDALGKKGVKMKMRGAESCTFLTVESIEDGSELAKVVL